MTIETILAERGATYGEYAEGTKIAMDLFAIMQAAPSYPAMSAGQQYAVMMICVKLARLLNGDPNHIDSWTDASAYCLLVIQTLTGENK